MNEPSPLHVLQMGTQFGVGGITRHVLALRDWMRARGHRVSLAGTPDVWAGQDGDPDFLALPTRYVAGEGSNVITRLGQSGRAAWKLRRWLAKNPVDLIHAHESAPAFVANLARSGMNIPLAVTYHGSEPERIASFGRIARRTDLVITPSYRSAEDLATTGRVPRERLKVIGLGVAPAPKDLDDEVAALRQELLADGTHVIVTIARLMYQKGIDILISCAVELRKTNPGFRFVVAGDGPDEDELRQMARDAGLEGVMRFVGRTNRPHLYLRAADILLLTSRWEALPFTIVEGFQVGTPSVATACSGVVELIDDEVGKVVPVGDIAGICEGVREVLSDADRLAQMGSAALARSTEDRFRPDWVHEQFEKTYLEVRANAT